MITDSIIVLLVCIMPMQQPKVIRQNRFDTAFEQADNKFDEKFKLDIELLKQASTDAVKSAEEKTKVERDRVMNQFKGIDVFRRKEEK